MDLLELEAVLSQTYPQSSSEDDDGQTYFKQVFNDGLAIALRNGLLTSSGTTLRATDKGWEQASILMDALKAERPDSKDIDFTPVAKPQGLSERAQARVEAMAQEGDVASLRQFIRNAVHGPNAQYAEAVLDSFFPYADAGGSVASRSGARRTRWATVLCEVIHELGGHADWASIAGAVERRPESTLEIAWREEIMQAMRKHRVPSGRAYFDVTEVGGQAVYVLTESGRQIVRRRTQDDRAPNLSKYLATAVTPGDGRKLTDVELYAMLFLACQLGRASDAQKIYEQLPPDFPDEDRYAVIPIWIQQASRDGSFRDDS